MTAHRLRLIFDANHLAAVQRHAARHCADPIIRKAGRFVGLEADEIDELGEHGVRTLAEELGLPLRRIVINQQ